MNTERRKILAMPPLLPDDQPIRVLLVDDQPMIGEAVRRALADRPEIVFHYCGDATEAIVVATRVKPTVILQDLVMPSVDGLTLLYRYRTNPATKNIPVVMLSTKEDPKTKSEAFRLGANDYLVKLPDTVELVARIQYHSKAYANQVQRDEAYQALHESQRELVEANITLQRLTNVDGLTGLSNRRYFDEYVMVQWKLAIREQNPFSLLMIDVDNFKRYNDTEGHVAGDEALKRLAAAIDSSFRRPSDLSARVGGEEFAAILPSTALLAAQMLGEELCRNVRELRIPHPTSTEGSGFVTVSVGAASIVPGPHDMFLSLMQLADEALYDAKRAGKNRLIARAPDPP
jgi:two-component system, chemotaxis family, response regulator WspR